ncbi:hypothetical protein LAZ67_15000347 [Cordylochernes scorpioides]|uniref:Uncharacterized protein n=1 Tax=Cordylochernes scorpioides TaxID=51811 RepID=A0ABY6L8C6_9ARAC|nr:hypothetical protein LAZ67_15000347 [Cordylochernes scorpioides]
MHASRTNEFVNREARGYHDKPFGELLLLMIPPPVKDSRPSHRQLFAASGSIIHTYGKRRLELDLGLGRLFRWPFIIADVGVSIIGADFLRHYGLTVDLRNHR